MKKPQTLSGWGEREVAKATTENSNNLVDAVNKLAEKSGIKFEDEDE